MKRITSLESFKSYLKTLTDEQIDATGKELEHKIRRVRAADKRLGYALMIDECVCEIGMRKLPSAGDIDLDELAMELTS